jgi:beta-1,4-mannosyl-glycoprotein beta-1,4-N-acetylglucosaminyltransferase
MTGYSHSDRVRDPARALRPAALQRAACAGADPFGLPPEAHSFRELAARWGPPPRSASAVGLPAWLLLHRARFRHLLPGGCVREARPAPPPPPPPA